MKILLIQPPIRDFYQTAIQTQPIGLAYLAASLQSHGHEVGILDCQTEKKKSIPIPPELAYLQDFYQFNDRSPFKLYSLEWVGMRSGRGVRHQKLMSLGSLPPLHPIMRRPGNCPDHQGMG